MFFQALPLVALLGQALACPPHDNAGPISHSKREDGAWSKRTPTPADWHYDHSLHWETVNASYETCHTGTQQSPINIGLDQVLSSQHKPDLKNIHGNFSGHFYNNGYGPAFTLDHDEGVYTTLPSIKYDDVEAYLTGWHIHNPSEHTIGGHRSKGEIHFVFADAKGKYKAVLGIRIDPSASASSPFFDQMPELIHFNETDVQLSTTLDLGLALDQVNDFNDFWTYKGSLTTPPCTEGVRWFVASPILLTSIDQMKQLIRACTYSARPEQEVWLHDINV
ncbi:carbonic anhydrase [Phyllosticta citribraziliensis]|uniref:Carbonic anhydrase n=1 Tax=Phyllosticta citribraziliensis TaxID=989973 RepID=A0ABR1LA00_9PEZI